MTYETITTRRHDDRIEVITLDRPDAANGLNPLMARELADAAARCDHDPGVKAVVLTATGRFFCAGGDVKAMAGFGAGAAAGVKSLADDLHRAVSTFARMPAPLIVAVNGVAAGAGFSLALLGDLVIAADAVSFTMAYTGVGLSPDGSSTWFLPRLVGLRRAQELMLTDRRLSAAEALEWGLVTRVVPGDSLLDEALARAADLARGSSDSNAAVKRLLLETYGNPLETQMELEGRTIAACAGSPNGQEGIAAFVAKRRPNYT